MKALKKKIDPDDFRARLGKTVRLRDWPTRVKRIYKDKQQYQELLQE